MQSFISSCLFQYNFRKTGFRKLKDLSFGIYKIMFRSCKNIFLVMCIKTTTSITSNFLFLNLLIIYLILYKIIFNNESILLSKTMIVIYLAYITNLTKCDTLHNQCQNYRLTFTIRQNCSTIVKNYLILSKKWFILRTYVLFNCNQVNWKISNEV